MYLLKVRLVSDWECNQAVGPFAERATAEKALLVMLTAGTVIGGVITAPGERVTINGVVVTCNDAGKVSVAVEDALANPGNVHA